MISGTPPTSSLRPAPADDARSRRHAALAPLAAVGVGLLLLIVVVVLSHRMDAGMTHAVEGRL